LPLILILTLLCALALLASPAFATTTIANTGGTLTVTGDGGPNRITIGAGDAPDTVTVSDPDAVDAPDCTVVDVATNAVQCPAAGTVEVDGGAGDDTFHLHDGLVDAVTCGDGLDDASDVEPDDTLTTAADCEETLATAGPPVTTIDGP